MPRGGDRGVQNVEEGIHNMGNERRALRAVLAWSATGYMAIMGTPTAVAEEQAHRQIEEVVVTAERRESTVQDTAISITAFTGQMIEDFGLRNQEDLQAFIPATTIDPYDVSVRGVGRTYRALGGDPGVATYFNGVYSEDFGIASTEGGLYDVERIEVLSAGHVVRPQRRRRCDQLPHQEADAGIPGRSPRGRG